MAIHVAQGQDLDHADPVYVLFDTEAKWAFGPVFDTADDAYDFMEWYETHYTNNPRTMQPGLLEVVYDVWVAGR